MKNNVNILHVEIKHEMTWIYIARIKRMKVGGTTWVLMKDHVDIFHVEHEHVVRVSFIRDNTDALDI